MERDQVLDEGAKLKNIGLDLYEPHEDDEIRVLRAALIGRLASTLQESRLHPILVGEPGVGKRTLVYTLAQMMAGRPVHQGDARTFTLPRGLKERHVYEVSVADFVSGAIYANQLEHKLRQLVANCKKEKAVLFFDNPTCLIGAGTGSSDPENDIANILLPYLRRNEFRVVAAATPEGYGLLRRINPAFAQIFVPLAVPEMTPAEARAVLAARIPHWRTRYSLQVEQATVDQAMTTSTRLFPWKRLPGRACEFTESVLALVASRLDPTQPPALPGTSAKAPQPAPDIRRGPDDTDPGMGPPAGAVLFPLAPSRPLGPEGLLKATHLATGLPLFLLSRTQRVVRDELVAALTTRVYGQERAVETVADRVLMIKAGLCVPGRPLATYLLTGPTGVGKTLLARALAQLLLGDERRLLRYDMSEFASIDTAESLLGDSHPRRRGRSLVESVLAEPMPVILLDEIEKAHRTVFDLLLQAIGDGRLTDMQGRTAYFTNAVVLMTTNLGSDGRRVEMPPRPADPTHFERESRRAVHDHFRAEFLNRLTDTLVFHSLGRRSIELIAEREIAALAAREGLVERGIKVTVTPELRQRLLEHGYSARLGARPMERAVESLVGAPLARFLAERPAEAHGCLEVGEGGVRVVPSLLQVALAGGAVAR